MTYRTIFIATVVLLGSAATTGSHGRQFKGWVVDDVASVPLMVSAGDLDGDGDVDLIASHGRSALVAWYENNGHLRAPHFERRSVSATLRNPIPIHVVDLDGDDDMDVLAASDLFDRFEWYENDGLTPPRFSVHPISAKIFGATWLASADMDGDGSIDLLSASSGDDKIAWYESDGGSPPAFTQHVITEAPGTGQQGFAGLVLSIFPSDLDGDGDTDILFSAPGGPRIGWFENLGGRPLQFQGHTIVSAVYVASFAADFDGDGDQDVIGPDPLDDSLVLYENDGGSPPGFVLRRITTGAFGAYTMGAGDFDGDGDLDLVAGVDFLDAIYWFENDGLRPPAFKQHTITDDPDGRDGPRRTLADNVQSIFVADMDGDGDPDIAFASRSNNTVGWFENRISTP